MTRRGHWITATAWPDDDGDHVWVGHECATGYVQHMLPWPTWSANADGKVWPSYSCEICGCHAMLEYRRAA